MTTAAAEKTKRYVPPRVHIIEEAGPVRIEAELAGVPKENVEIEVKQGE